MGEYDFGLGEMTQTKVLKEKQGNEDKGEIETKFCRGVDGK